MLVEGLRAVEFARPADPVPAAVELKGNTWSQVDKWGGLVLCSVGFAAVSAAAATMFYRTVPNYTGIGTVISISSNSLGCVFDCAMDAIGVYSIKDSIANKDLLVDEAVEFIINIYQSTWQLVPDGLRERLTNALQQSVDHGAYCYYARMDLEEFYVYPQFFIHHLLYEIGALIGTWLAYRSYVWVKQELDYIGGLDNIRAQANRDAVAVRARQASGAEIQAKQEQLKGFLEELSRDLSQFAQENPDGFKTLFLHTFGMLPIGLDRWDSKFRNATTRGKLAAILTNMLFFSHAGRAERRFVEQNFVVDDARNDGTVRQYVDFNVGRRTLALQYRTTILDQLARSKLIPEQRYAASVFNTREVGDDWRQFDTDAQAEAFFKQYTGRVSEFQLF